MIKIIITSILLLIVTGCKSENKNSIEPPETKASIDSEEYVDMNVRQIIDPKFCGWTLFHYADVGTNMYDQPIYTVYYKKDGMVGFNKAYGGVFEIIRNMKGWKVKCLTKKCKKCQ